MQGQYGAYMHINDATINGFGCGPKGPMDCSVGTTPSQHFARGKRVAARQQKLLVGSVQVRMDGDDRDSHKLLQPKPAPGIGNEAASHGGQFFSQKGKKVQLKGAKKHATQSLSPVPGKDRATPNEYWNGLPADGHFNPYVDLEHTGDMVTKAPWTEHVRVASPLLALPLPS